MDEKSKKEKELKFYKEIELKLSAGSVNSIIETIKELRKKGNPSIMPLILNLLETTESDIIVKEILSLASELKDSKTVPSVIGYINDHPKGKYLANVIAACWQSGLDFSSDILVFTNCFIDGNYEVALESFTVIEEMIWRTSIDKINACRENLTKSLNKIAEEKKPLYKELVKILDEGISINREEFPDLYLN